MRPGLPTLLRDTVAWIGGWLIMFRQAGVFFDPPSQPNDTALYVAGVLIGAPGLLQLWQARSGGPASTAGSQPEAPPEESSPSSSGASSGAE